MKIDSHHPLVVLLSFELLLVSGLLPQLLRRLLLLWVRHCFPYFYGSRRHQVSRILDLNEHTFTLDFYLFKINALLYAHG